MAYVRKDNLGEMGVHFYELDGAVNAFECSVEEYEALGKKEATQPKLPEGARWIHSIKRPRFDTADGTLGEGEYGVDGKGICWVRPIGGTEVLTNEEDFIDHEPNEKALEDMSRQQMTTSVMVEIKKG